MYYIWSDQKRGFEPQSRASISFTIYSLGATQLIELNDKLKRGTDEFNV